MINNITAVLINSIHLFFFCLNTMIMIYIIVSWFPHPRVIHYTRPFLNTIAPLFFLVRRYTPRVGYFDFSAIIIIFLGRFIENVSISLVVLVASSLSR